MQDPTVITDKTYTPWKTPSLLGQQEEDAGSGFQSVQNILYRRWIVFTLVSIVVCAFQISNILKRPPIYQETFRLLVQPPEQDISNPLEGAASAVLNNSGSSGVDYYDTQITIMLSNKLLNPILLKVYQKYPELNEQNFSYDDFIKQLSITRSNKGQVLEISYIDSNPQRVKFVLDRISEAYLAYTQSDQRSKTQIKLKFVNQQIPILQNKVVFLQNELLKIQRKYYFYSPDDQGQYYSGKLNNILQQRGEIALQIQQNQSLLNTIQKQLNESPSNAISSDTLAQSPQYMQLVSRLNQINLELAKKSTLLTDDSPVIQQLKTERNNLIPLINQQSSSLLKTVREGQSNSDPLATAPNAIRSSLITKLLDTSFQLKALKAQEQSLSLSEIDSRKKLQDFTRIVASFLNIQRELQLSIESLNRLSAASQTLEIENAKRFTPWQLVSVIEEPKQPENNLPRDILLAVLMGLIAGTAAAMLAENLDQTYHDPEELAKGTGQKILGSIPIERTLAFIQKKQMVENPANFLESFAVLYSNLFFLGQKQTCRSFVISSAASGDGKSTTSFFLALAAAKLGQRVLLIDGDRYFPQGENWRVLAKIFEKDLNSSEEALDKSKAMEVQDVEFMAKNLFYFKTKDNAMEPEQLMSSTSLLRLIQKWQEIFDVILIDTPPILGISDSKLIASKTDGVLLVVRLDKTHKDSIRQSMNELSLANLTLLGFVANGVKRHGTGYSYNYYYQNRYYQRKASTANSSLNQEMIKGEQ
jgi:capsular exopolysaccharide synthesis family protein